MVANIPGEETVQYQIYMDAVQALQSLRSLTTSAESLDDVINTSAKAMQDFSKTSGLSLKATENLFKNILARAEQMRELLTAIPELSSIVGKNTPLAQLANVESPFTFLGKNVGFTEINARVREANKELALAEKNAQKVALNLLRADDAAKKLATSVEKPAEVLGRTFTPKQFAPVLQQFQSLSKINFSNVSQYAQNVQSLMSGIRNLSQQTGASIQDVGKYIQQNFQNVPKVALQDAIKNLNNEMRGGEPVAKNYARSIDAVRIALGAIVAMVVFRTINFIEESMRKAIETAKEFETSLYRLANVERILSQGGIEVSLKGLRKGIEEIRKLLPIFSEADITQQVSLIGIMTKELGYTEDQIIQLGKAIGVLNIRSAEQEDLMATTNKVLTSLVAPSGKGVPSLGIDLSEAHQKSVAVSEGLLKAGESLDNLTQKEKGLVKLKIVLESTGEEVLNISDYLESNVAKLQESEAAWEDLLRVIGQAILPFIPVLTSVFNMLVPVMNVIRTALFGIVVALGTYFAIARVGWSAFLQSLQLVSVALVKMSRGDFAGAAQAIKDNITNIIDGFKNVGKVIEEATTGESVEKLAKRFFPELVEGIETATDETGNLGDAITDLPGFEDLIDDITKLQEKLRDTQFDFDLETARDLEDHLIDMRRMLEDFARKREDIIDDANDKIDNANKKHRNKEIDEEARFQEQMRQLREKFLFNLEDALRERDARQVLRLQRQYEMDKTALQNEHALRGQEADRQHQEDLQRIKEERDERLAELAEEERIKRERAEEDFALEQSRKAEDHARDMAQLEQEINDRLMEFARAIGEEYNLNQEGVDALYDLLLQYYGPNGAIPNLYDYSYDYIVSRAGEMLALVNSMVSQAEMMLGSIGSRTPIAPIRTPSNIGPQAKGGTYFANRRTKAEFGESGPELAMFLPLNGSMTGKMPAGLSPASGKDGEIDLNVWLSPDLEARIVRNSMDATAGVFAKVNRSKDR